MTADLTPRDLMDDAARPKAPAFENLNPLQELNGRGLAAIHRWYLRDLSAVGRLMAEIRDGMADPASLAPRVRDMQMAQNFRQFGTACGEQCRALTSHHQIEDGYLYPQLERHGNDPLNAVLTRLRAEHAVIHDLIIDLWDAAAALSEGVDRDDFHACATAFVALDQAVRSHFRYEETELAPALGFYDMRV
ncbi:hemerythrin domain-containing protein [uncultured Paracoccus sp.]|uniref:hemerythrin domain-containing protein n=1 Tax=uncultured Paracoccus sp. TaxID=189685 RepID=UPI002604328D|nr:hemerythrin domain-containing protein [uncultured Paracoccus sp.]